MVPHQEHPFWHSALYLLSVHTHPPLPIFRLQAKKKHPTSAKYMMLLTAPLPTLHAGLQYKIEDKHIFLNEQIQVSWTQPTPENTHSSSS